MKISKFDDRGGSTIGKSRKKNSKGVNMTWIKNPASIDERVNDIRVYYTNSHSIINKIDLLRELECVENVGVIAITKHD